METGKQLIRTTTASNLISFVCSAIHASFPAIHSSSTVV
ncbi:unnamed protein product [Brassica oleracea var. botrytis]